MKITLGPHQIKVLSTDEVTFELAKEGKFGEFDLDTLEIRLRNDVAETVWRETLCHEMVHAVVAMTHLQVRLDEDLQEEVCRSFGPYLAQMGLFSHLKPPRQCVKGVTVPVEPVAE